jgi:hypothetical protein
MLKKLSEEEQILFECLCMSRSFVEIMFSNLDNLLEFEDEKFAFIRPYQETMLSYEYSVATDPELSDKENFLRKKGAGDSYAIASRRIGKSLVFLICDMLQSIMLLAGCETAFGSYDANHVRKIFSSIIPVVEYHPCYKGIKKVYNQTPQYLYIGKNGMKISGVNENAINQRKAGENWIGLHPMKTWYEEISRWCSVAQEKQTEAVSELGVIFRGSGMADCTKNSPAGEIVSDRRNKNIIINYSQFVNPTWDEYTRKESLKKYKSEASFGWKVYVLGELVEDGYSALDMKLVSECYNDTTEIKNIEINKTTFSYYQDLLIVDKPKDAECTYIATDISDIGTTETVIIFDTLSGLKYRYNITMLGLTDEQIYLVLKFLGEKLGANVLALDCGEAAGRGVSRRLLKDFSAENIFEYAGNKKIVVEFERTKDNYLKYDTAGKAIVKEEFMSEWAVQIIKEIFYNKRIDIPIDHKLDEQLSKLVSTKSGNRVLYAISGEDHLFDAFKVFCCAWWQNHLSIISPIKKKKFCKTGVTTVNR